MNKKNKGKRERDKIAGKVTAAICDLLGLVDDLQDEIWELRDCFRGVERENEKLKEEK